MKEHAEFVTVLPITMPIDPFLKRGPLELVGEPGTNESFVTDTASRERYVADPFARSLLWGSAHATRRYHRDRVCDVRVQTSRETEIRLRFESLELLRLDIDGGRRGLAVVHGRLAESPSPLVECLAELADIDARHGDATRAAYQDYLGPTLPIEAGNRRARMLFLVESSASLPILDANSNLSLEDQWLWYLATCQMPSRITIPAGAAKRLGKARLATSGSWNAAAFGDAVVYLNTRGRARDEADEIDFARRWLRFRTIDTDLVLLVEAQTAICTSIKTELAAMQTEVGAQPSVAQSRRLLSLYRSTYWDNRLLERGPGVRLLELLYANRDLNRQVRDLRHRMRDLEREVQSALASRTSAALGLLAVFGLPMSVAMTAWSIGGPHNSWAGVLAVVAALGASAVILLILPGLRGLIGDAFLIGWRKRK